MSISYRRGDKYKLTLGGLSLQGLNNAEYKLVLTGNNAESSTGFVASKRDRHSRFKKKNGVAWDDPLFVIIPIVKDGRLKFPVRITLVEKSRNREKNYGRVELDLAPYVGGNISKREEMPLRKDKNTLFKMHITCQNATAGRPTSPSMVRAPLERKYSESASQSMTNKNAKIRTEIEKKDREITKLKDRLRKLQAEEEKQAGGINAETERLEREIANLEGRINGAAHGGDAEKEENERLKSQLQMLRQQYDTDAQEVELLRDQKSLNSGDVVQKMRRQLDDLSKQQMTLQTELIHRESRVAELKHQLSNIKAQGREQEAQKIEESSQIEEIQLQLGEKKRLYERQEQHIKYLEKQSSSAASIRQTDEGSQEVRIKKLKKQIARVEKEEDKLKEENEQLQSRVAKLQGDSRSYSEKIAERRRDTERALNEGSLGERKQQVNYQVTSERVAADAKAQSEIRHGQSELQMIQNAHRLEKDNKKTIRHELDAAIRTVAGLKYQVQQLQRQHEELVSEKASQGSNRRSFQTTLRHRVIEAEREARGYRAETQRAQMKIRHLQQQLYLAQDQAKFGSLLEKNKRRGLQRYQPPASSGVRTSNTKSRTTALLEALLIDIDAEKASLRRNGYSRSLTPALPPDDDYESKQDYGDSNAPLTPRSDHQYAPSHGGSDSQDYESTDD